MGRCDSNRHETALVVHDLVCAFSVAPLALVLGHRPVDDDLVDDAEFLGFLWGQKLVPVHRRLDDVQRLAGVLGVNFVETGAQRQNLARMNFYVGGLTLGDARGEGSLGEKGNNPMKRAYSFRKAPRCSATSKRTGKPCQAPAVRGWTVCRFHGARGGAPKGKANGAYRHGLYTAEAIEERRFLRELLGESRDMLAILPCEGKL